MKPNKTSWSLLFEEAREKLGDSSSIVAIECKDWYRQFDYGFGGTEGSPFTAWTEERVYFPIMYDGSEWVGSAPRSPNGEALEHQGG
jgi:hypothetical protein